MTTTPVATVHCLECGEPDHPDFPLRPLRLAPGRYVCSWCDHQARAEAADDE